MSKQQKHFRIFVRSPKYDFVHDPILENPLDDEFETLISMVGERRYLTEIVKRFKIQMTKDIGELTDHECRKCIRGIMRHSEDYNGPEMMQ
jgi:hypothetical protein